MSTLDSTLERVTMRWPGFGRAEREAESWGAALLVAVSLCWSSALVIGFIASLRLLFLIGLLVAIIGLFRPIVGVLGIGLLMVLDVPARVYVMTGGLLRWNTLSYWLALVTLLGLPGLLRRSDLQTRLWQVFVLIMAVGLIITPDRSSGLQRLLDVGAAFGILAYLSAGARSVNTWFWLGLVCGVAGAGGGLAFYAGHHALTYITTASASESINPNAWSHMPLTAMFALCLGARAAQRRTWGEFVYELLAFINLTWVFLSGSRGNMLIGTCCALFLIGVSTSAWTKVRAGLAAVVVIGALSVQFSSVLSYSVGRLAMSFDPRLSLTTRSSGRWDIVRGGWHMFTRHPLGVGTGGFDAAWHLPGGGDEVPTVYTTTNEVDAHSGWLEVLVENGIPGIIAFMAFVLSFSIAAPRSRERYLQWLGFLVTGAFALGFLSTAFESKGLWFLAAGVIVLLHPAASRSDSVPAQY